MKSFNCFESCSPRQPTVNISVVILTLSFWRLPEPHGIDPLLCFSNSDLFSTLHPPVILFAVTVANYLCEQ